MHRVQQRVVPISREASRQRRDIDQEVRLYNYQPRHDTGFLRPRRSIEIAVKQVELHPLAQQFVQIAEIAPLVSIAVVDDDGSFFGIGLYRLFIERAHDAAQISTIDGESLRLRLQVDR